MTRRAILVALGLAAALGACRAPEPIVPLSGPTHGAPALAGHWSGEYASPITGRRGTIDLRITSDGDSASGVIMMVPAGFGQPLEPWPDPALAPNLRSSTTPARLTVKFIAVDGSKVTGMMTPYADPETGERLTTAFAGRLSGDTIAGTFSTRPGQTPDGETGRWIVVRER